MMNTEAISEKLISERLRVIHDYVKLQEKLVADAVSRLPRSATEFDFEEFLPPTITVDGVEWSTWVHGVGVMFEHVMTHVVIDAHRGFLDAPSAFDAWRLIQYCESIWKTEENFESWEATLETLARSGVIERQHKHERHYILR